VNVVGVCGGWDVRYSVGGLVVCMYVHVCNMCMCMCICVCIYIVYVYAYANIFGGTSTAQARTRGLRVNLICGLWMYIFGVGGTSTSERTSAATQVRGAPPQRSGVSQTPDPTACPQVSTPHTPP